MLDLDAYFARIGYAGPRQPTLATLRELQERHAAAIPFENLDSLAGSVVRLDLESLQRKLVGRRRGGYCFEQNLLFQRVVEALGFDVTALAARVVWERPPAEVGPRTHMLLVVSLAEGDHLCDVGFGGLTPTAPLRLAHDAAQPTPHEPCRVVKVGGELAVEACVRGVWKPLYRFDLQAQALIDIEVLNFYVACHSASPMKGRLLAARAVPNRRYALRDGTFSVHHLDGRHEQRALGSVAELRGVLGEAFGIAVPAAPALDEALGRLLD